MRDQVGVRNVVSRRATGNRGEDLAAAFLEKRGWTILGRNVRTARGELDLVARDADTLVFVEVRTRRGNAFGSPEESVTPRKQQKLVELAESYLETQPSANIPCRIDVVVVELGPRGETRRIELIEGAVE